MRRKIANLLTVVLAISALVCLVLNFFDLGKRTDTYEVHHAASPAQSPNTLSLSVHSHVSLMLCVQGEHIGEAPDTLYFADTTIELKPARHLSLPRTILKAHELSPTAQCHAPPALFDLQPGEYSLLIPQDHFIFLFIAAPVSSGAVIWRYLAMIAALLVVCGLQVSTPWRYRPSTYTDALLAFGAYLIGSIVFSAILSNTAGSPSESFLSFRPALTMMSIIQLITFGTALIFILARTRRPPSPPIKTGWLAGLVPFGTGLGLAVFAIATVMVFPQPGINQTELGMTLPSLGYLTAHFAILAAISEEILFRGIIQTSLTPQHVTKPHLAIAIATIFFVLIHIPQSADHPWVLIPIAAVSVSAGYLKAHFQSIFPAIALHMTYNAALVVPSILQLPL
ncbi:MAG: CPBP family intramembrane metalloprotease [Proteobacteria bacterium]|nr:CPBP family intramembrane metalloprotease [Pseudomonadota bacterium]